MDEGVLSQQARLKEIRVRCQPHEGVLCQQANLKGKVERDDGIIQ
jgi:hypothetical protein